MRISDWSSDVCSSDLQAFIEKFGLPSAEVWPEAVTESQLRQELDTIRQCGYARQETASHIFGVACAVREKGQVVASLSVYLPMSRLGGKKEVQVLDALRETASRISEKLT